MRWKMEHVGLFEKKYSIDFSQTQKKLENVLNTVKEISSKGLEYFKTYEFILCCTEFYEKSDDEDFAVVLMLMSLYKTKTSELSKREFFVIFYLACLFYYRKRDVKQLRDLINQSMNDEETRFSLDIYPVLWNLACRYSVLMKDYKRILKFSEIGARKTNDNPAMLISYVEAVCNEFQRRYYNSAENSDKECPKCFADKVDDVKKSDAPVFDGGDDCELLIKAFGYAYICMNTNSDYAKYYVLAAKLFFFTYVYCSDPKNRDVLSEVIAFDVTTGERNTYEKELKKAVNKICRCVYKKDEEFDLSKFINDVSFAEEKVKDCVGSARNYAKSEAERSGYNQFWEVAEAFFKKQPKAVFGKKNNIINSASRYECIVNGFIKSSRADNNDYVIVSYSSMDYKPVFCDIVELQSRGVQVVFDETLDKTADCDGKEWYAKFRNLLYKSKAVLCFLSENYVMSSAVERELKMIAQCKNPVIVVDLTGKKRISEVIGSVYRNGNELDSTRLKRLTAVMSDEKTVFPREGNDDAVLHLDGVVERLRNQCGEVFRIVTAEDFSCRNTCGHPAEDFFINDKNFFVVADGITRQEGYVGEYSVAAKFTETFLDVFRQSFGERLKRGGDDVKEIMRGEFASASVRTENILCGDAGYKSEYEKAEELAKSRGVYFEKPGCTSAVVYIDNGTMYYGHVGDSGIILVRDGQVIALTRSQTYYAFKIDGKERERKTLYGEYVNKPENPHGYGIVNGDGNVESFFDVASIKLKLGDVIYIMTDGTYDFFWKHYDKSFDESGLYNIFRMQGEKEKDKLDDRTMIRVRCSRL